MTASSSPAPRAGRREWVGLAVLALACLMYVMDLTVLHLAVPSISEDLQPTSSQLLWIIDIYGFMVAGFLVTMGTLGDRVGRRKLLLVGSAIFGVASILAAFSTSTATAGKLNGGCWVRVTARAGAPRSPIGITSPVARSARRTT